MYFMEIAGVTGEGVSGRDGSLTIGGHNYLLSAIILRVKNTCFKRNLWVKRTKKT